MSIDDLSRGFVLAGIILVASAVVILAAKLLIQFLPLRASASSAADADPLHTIAKEWAREKRPGSSDAVHAIMAANLVDQARRDGVGDPIELRAWLSRAGGSD